LTILTDPHTHDRDRAAPTSRPRCAGPASPGRPVSGSAWVIGVDTHTDTHTATLIDDLATTIAETVVAATPAGYAQLQTWAETQVSPGQRLFWAVEGTRSHGHGLTRHLQATGHHVIEAPKPATGRRQGKSDPLDAVHAAQSALATDRDPNGRHNEPRADGVREALRMLLITRRHDTDMRTATVNLFKSLLLGAGNLRETLRGLTTLRQINTITALPDDPGADLETQVRLHALRQAATTIRNLDQAITANEKQLRTLVQQTCPGLLELPGVGPVTATVLLTTWSHPGRIHSEAAYAALAGISPIPASSGRITRHRLNRGGDRTLNAALHTIVITRRRMNHPPTTDYITRRTTEGRTPKEILRCLKRYAIRNLYRYMQANTITA
jgi:transposase